MKTIFSLMITALVTAGLLFASSAAADPPVPGLIISDSDMAFLETRTTNVRTPLSTAAPVGLFSAAQVEALSVPYVRVAADTVVRGPEPISGLMITGADLRFIAGPEGSEGFLQDEWAAGPSPVGAGR
jgi:hypothetical protein